MLYSGSHSSALTRLYSQLFRPVPPEVSEQAAKSGQAQALMAALDKATTDRQPISDWTPFVTPRQESSRQTAKA